DGLRRIVVGPVQDPLDRKIDVDRELDPARPGDPFRWHEDASAGGPVACPDDHAAQGPRSIVEQETVDVTDVAVDGRDSVVAEQPRAPEARATRTPARPRRARAPEESAECPVVRHRVALPKQGDRAATDRLVAVHARAAADLLAAE